MIEREDFRELLFMGVKYLLITLAVLHFLATLISWRQIFVMHQQLRTRTGGLLILANLINVFIVFATIVITVLVLGTELP